MAKTPIDTIQMTRAIREAHAEALQNASPEERIRFYREKALRLHSELRQRIASVHSELKPD